MSPWFWTLLRWGIFFCANFKDCPGFKDAPRPQLGWFWSDRESCAVWMRLPRSDERRAPVRREQIYSDSPLAAKVLTDIHCEWQWPWGYDKLRPISTEFCERSRNWFATTRTTNCIQLALETPAALPYLAGWKMAQANHVSIHRKWDTREGAKWNLGASQWKTTDPMVDIEKLSQAPSQVRSSRKVLVFFFRKCRILFPSGASNQPSPWLHFTCPFAVVALPGYGRPFGSTRGAIFGRQRTVVQFVDVSVRKSKWS